MRIGAHMSISGGVHRALERAKTLGCETIQIFTKSPGNWRLPPLSDPDLERWRFLGSKSGLRPVVAHDCYLVNLASPDDALRRRSLETLEGEVRRALTLGIRLFVIHPGAHRGAGQKKALKLISGALARILDRCPAPDFRILLETTAGQGTAVGYRFEHLAHILEQCPERDRLGVCLDTCHVFAAGYDIRTREGYESVMEEFDRLVGLEKLLVIHANDSKRELGSRVDRHEHIGRGRIGKDPFGFLLSDERLRNLPFIIETPKGAGLRRDRRNLGTLFGMRTEYDGGRSRFAAGG